MTQERSTREKLNPEQKLRHFMEQVIVAQQMAGSTPRDAIDVAAEVEAHCRIDDKKVQDPFKEFGDPTDYGQEIVAPKTTKRVLTSMMKNVLVMMPFIFIALFILGLLGLDTLSRGLLLGLSGYIGLSVVAATAMVEFGLSKKDQATKLRISTIGSVMLMMAFMIWVAAYFAIPEEGVRLDSVTGSIILMVGSFGVALLSIFLYGYITKPTKPVGSESDGKTVSEIINDMNTAGLVKGWVKYSPGGVDLDDMGLKEIFGFKKS